MKNYDNAFVSIFARVPARQDKEPMRPLYMYYQNLRKAITKKAFAKAGKPGARANSVEGGVNSSKLSVGSIGASSDQGRDKIRLEEDKSEEKPTWGADNERELKKQIHDYMKERKNLRKVLDNFQKEFLKTYNRKLKFTKDIAPVANEFKRYKELKREIAKLEGILSSIKKAEKK